MKNESEEGIDLLKSDNVENPSSLGSSSATGTAIAEETENAEDDDVSVENYESHYSLQHSGGSRSSLASDSTRNSSSTIPLHCKLESEKYSRNVELRPGECVMRTLFYDFTQQTARKMEEVMAEPLEKPLSKILQRGEDSQFDQLIVAFGTVAEHCLPSLLKTLFAWYERQLGQYEPDLAAPESKKNEPKGKSESTECKDVEALLERRDLAIEFMFCLVLIEVLHQLPFHPGHEDLIGYIENVSFKHFKYREGVQTGPNASNIHTLADLYAEVISILAQSRFQSVRKRFTAELKELRSKEPSPQTTQSIISLLMGMKFFRVKMVPIEEFEASFLFMQDCAQYFLEVKDKDIKHALAGLFVEILVPVAATVKNEVNVPCLKNFVESLYSQTLDMCTKSKHRLAIFPLVTCLLCVSQKSFFLQNWYYFLAMCLSHLKNRDPKMSRVALESLYRLLWVYMIRIKCESNSATLSRLQSIVNSLFPKGSKGVVPRDTPLNIFVKIIQFIAQERLDFAMREIVFDLLSVGRNIKMILTPERMSIGLRAFLVVADSLQQKEGEPPMPRTSGVLPSGNTLRIKKTYLNKALTDDTARSIGMSSYFPHVRRVFVEILRALDNHYGRPLMMTSTQNVNKEPDEMLTGERKPRIDLFRTCVAAVPRLLPELMTSSDLVEMLSRLTVHMDEELRALAYQSLQTLVIDFPDWRNDVIFGFSHFLAKDLLDTFPQLLDNGLRMLLQLLTSWKNAISPNAKILKEEHNRTITRKIDRGPPSQAEMESSVNVFHQVEGLALVMLCNCRQSPRRLGIHILREIKCLFKLIGKSESVKTVIDVMDRSCPQILEKCVSLLPTSEKATLLVTANVDLQWLADRASTIWSTGLPDDTNAKTSVSSLKNGTSLDIWTICIFCFLQKDILISQCPSAVCQAWPVVWNRLNSLFSVIDPTPVSDNRASLLRSSAPPRKPASERDQFMLLWRTYVVFAMRVVPPAPSPVVRCASPDLSLSLHGSLNLHSFLKHAWEEFENDSYSLNCVTISEPKTWRFRSSSSPDNMTSSERNESKLVNATPAGLYKLVVPLLRCETVDVRDAAVYALSSINADALKDLMEELAVYIRDAIDKKQENMRRRRRRDALRLQLVKVFELIAEHGTFGVSSCVLDRDTHTLHPTIIEYIDGARICLEIEADKESLRDIKLHFCNFIKKMIKSFSLEKYPTLLKRDLRSNLFSLFRSWSGPYGSALAWNTPPAITIVTTTAAVSGEAPSISEEELQFAALQAMSAILCCGPCFDVKNLLSDEGSLYGWLNTLLSSRDEKVYKLAYETVILLLECNPDVGSLLDWVVDKCYTAEPQVADGCFLALAVIFSAREYPCDHYTAIINVTLMNTGCPRKNVHETALQLLQVLDKRFFGAVGLLPPEPELGKDFVPIKSGEADDETVRTPLVMDKTENKGDGTSAKDRLLTESEENSLLKSDDIVPMDTVPPTVGLETSLTDDTPNFLPLMVETKVHTPPPGFPPIPDHDPLKLSDLQKRMIMEKQQKEIEDLKALLRKTATEKSKIEKESKRRQDKLNDLEVMNKILRERVAVAENELLNEVSEPSKNKINIEGVKDSNKNLKEFLKESPFRKTNQDFVDEQERIEERVMGRFRQTIREEVQVVLDAVLQQQPLQPIIPPQQEAPQPPPVSKDNGTSKNFPPSSDYLMEENPKLKFMLERGKKNFKIWRQMLITELSLKRLGDIIDDSIEPYCEYTEPQTRERYAQVKGIILAHITEEYQEMVIDMKDPKEIVERLAKLKREEINDTTLSIMDKINHMKYDINKESFVDFDRRFNALVRKYEVVAGAQLDDQVHQDAYYRAVSFSVPDVKTATYADRARGVGNGFSVEELRRFATNFECENKPNSQVRQGGAMYAQQARDGQTICGKCGDVGHVPSTCPHPEGVRRCYNCLKLTDKHIGKTCPSGMSDSEKEKTETLDCLLSTTYCCSQTQLSQQLSILHPELTMPMFSEITNRFQTARSEVRHLLLQYLLPWLHNMELVDPNVPPNNSNSSYYQYYVNDVRKAGPRREGWGSKEATQMVLNNLFYITAKFSNEYSKEIEDIWATLCSCWPNNLKIILRYLIIVCGMAPNELLAYAKRVTVYLARACSDKLLDEMLIELQTVETLNCSIERTETPPYYRLTSVRKVSGYSDPDPHSDQHNNNELSIEKGTIHTKRHSSEEGVASNAPGTCKSDSSVRVLSESKYGTVKSNKSRMLAMSPHIFDEKPSSTDEIGMGSSASGDDDYTICRDDGTYMDDIPVPHPLPMPEYGGYFAPLIEYIPESVQASSGFHRCNLAVILLTDVVDSLDLDWSAHIPLMLHILFLGMDQSRNLINQHCKQLLLNLLIVLGNHSDYLTVAHILLNRKVMHLELELPTPCVSISIHNFTEADPLFDSYLQSPIGSSQSTSLAVIPSPTSTCDTVMSPTNVPVISAPTIEESVSPASPSKPIQDVIKSLIDFLASKKDQVLWNYEDITAKVWSIRSGEQLDTFLQHVLRIFQESLPHALINERWAQTALHLGLSCSSRHYAGRSLQVFRFLRVPITSRMLSDILSRLVETIAEQGEDMQGYVTELLLTLESAVDSLDSDFRPLDCMKEIFKSTPNLNKDIGAYGPVSKRFGHVGADACALGHLYNSNAHVRSTSYSVSHYYTRKTGVCPPNIDNKDMRRETDSKYAYNKYTSNLSRSRSAQSLKLMDSTSQDDKMLILAQLFWLAVSVLESDYEYEYLLALRLLNRVLHRLPLDRPDTVDKVEKLYGQLKWASFQGVQSLLLKGCTNPAIYEAVVPLLSQFTLFLDLAVVDPSQSLGFPLNVVALLPYMLLHYEDANELCISSAENIALVSTEKGKKLENLGTVMTLYSRRTFSKESFQWTKCVVKYLHDTYSQVSMTMLTFLVELLEKGPSVIQLPVLNIVHCMLHYVDLSPTAPQPFNSELLVSIAKFIEGVHHKEAIKILKLVVTRSSTLVAAPSSQYPFLESHYSSTMCPTFADVEVFVKKELPGRTMDFTFDVKQTPLIGKNMQARNEADKTDDVIRYVQQDVVALQSSANQASNSPKRSSSLSPADNAAIGWKRPWMSQSRVRECLVSLLTTCGQRVGLPKSPSVIFSQSSDLLERQSSMASSTEEVSAPDLSAESRRNESDHFGVFKDFDFLEYESESVEGESTDNFNWGVRRRPLSGADFDGDITIASQAADSLSEKTPLLTIRTGAVVGIDDSSDEELGSESPLDEIPPLSSHIHDTQSSSSSIRLHERERRDSATRSDISDSSVGDLGDLTPCNTSPNLPAVMSFRSIHRDDNEEMWRFQLCLLFEQTPNSSLHVFHLIYKLVKDLVNKSISVTHCVCNILSQFEGTSQLQTHLTTITCILASRARPVFVWYNVHMIPLTETLKFGLLQLREHLDTFLDRKDQANECLETLKAILKLQQLRDESVGTELVNEESVVDVGKALYKFHVQLLLLLETANRMYHSLITTSTEIHLENISSEVIAIKKSLAKAQEESSDLSEDGTPSPQLLFPDHTDSTIIQFINEKKWSSALRFIRQNRITWLTELVSSGPDDEDDVVNILTVFCNHLVEKKTNMFVMLDSDDIFNIHGCLMDELMQLLISLNDTESKIKEQKEKNYASH